jgi:hypothetical protein
MRRRSFLKSGFLASTGAALGGNGLAGVVPSADKSTAPKRKILAWSHSYLDFQGEVADVRREFERARDSGIELLILFVHSVPQENNAWYNTDLPGFVVEDRLTRLQTISGKTGLEIHPVILGVSDTGLSKSVRDARSYASGAPGGHKRDGTLCATWEATRAGTLRIAADVIARHEPKGLQIDFIRYWDTGIGLEWPCTCAACRRGYREFLGRDSLTAADLKNPGILYKYLQFRNGIITSHLLNFQRLLKQSGLEYSIAARADYFGSALVEGQDWLSWGRRGLVDFICPMNYKLDRKEHREILSLQLQILDGAVPVYSGIGRKWSGGEITAEEMIRQAEDAFALGAAGISIFHFNALQEADFSALKEFSRRI